MDEGFKVTCAAVRGLKGDPVLWTLDKSIPFETGMQSKIEQIIVVGDMVDVFARVMNGAKQSGLHVRLPSPIVLFTIEKAPREAWSEAMQEEGDRDFTGLTDSNGRPWAVNQPIDGWGATVVRVVCDPFGTAKVYALPDPGTDAANKGVGLRVTFFPQTGFMLEASGMPINEWMDLQEEVASFDAVVATGEEPDTEPEATDNEVEEEEVQVAAAPEPVNGANGVAHSALPDLPAPPDPVGPPGV